MKPPTWRSLATPEVLNWLAILQHGEQPKEKRPKRTAHKAVELRWAEYDGDTVRITPRGRDVVREAGL